MPPNLEKIIAGAALLLLLSLSVWFLLQRNSLITIVSRDVRVSLTPDSYTSTSVSVPTSAARVWNDPTVAAAQPEWVFDVFTPPVIYYNRLTQEFTVTPPDYSTPPEIAVEGEPKVPVFGVELIAVESEPFRLQLVGYAGGEGNTLGMFENMNAGDVVIGRAGRFFPDLGLTVQTLTVTRESVEAPDSMPITQVVARAGVLDNRTGEVVQLSSLQRRAQGTPSARLRIVPSAEERTEKIGGEFRSGVFTYRVEAIKLEPTTVRITRTESETGAVVTKTLVVGWAAPAAPGGLPTPAAENAPTSPANDPITFFGN